MTEDEAKTKWCPFVRINGSNRLLGDASSARLCIGSGCMAWRWNAWIVAEESRATTPGFCGLAGALRP